MPLMAQVLFGREFLVQTGKLEGDAKVFSDLVRLGPGVQTADSGTAARGSQQGRQDFEESGFPAAIGSQQSKNFPLMHIERNVPECIPTRSTSPCRGICMTETLNFNRGKAIHPRHPVSR